MISFHFTATPTAMRFRMSGLLTSAEGRVGVCAAAAPTATKAPNGAGITGVDRLEASLGHVATDGFYTVPVRVVGAPQGFAAPQDVPGVRAWSPPV